MNKTLRLLALMIMAAAQSDVARADEAPPPAPAGAGASEGASRADKRYEEMLSRMQASIEDIAQMYGNPVFLQIFTNDMARATELKERLHAEKRTQDMEKQVHDLALRKEGLLDDIALKEREAAKLTRKLAVQRAALDAVAGALEQARTAVEDTAK